MSFHIKETENNLILARPGGDSREKLTVFDSDSIMQTSFDSSTLLSLLSTAVGSWWCATAAGPQRRLDDSRTASNSPRCFCSTWVMIVVSLGKVLAAEPAVEAGAFLPQGVAVSAPCRRVHEAQNVLGVD